MLRQSSHPAPAVGFSSRRVGLSARLALVWRRSESVRGYALLSPTLLVMLALLGAPLVALLVVSFWTQNEFSFDRMLTFNNYLTIFDYAHNALYLKLLKRSILMSASATAAVILLAYPIAYFLVFRVREHRMVWMILITVPFWTSYLLRIFAWKIILGFNGVINSGLIHLGVIEQPLEFLLYNPTAVTITLAHAWAAYAILPIYVSLEKIDRTLLEAATDLGDGPVKRFLRVTLPLSMPGTLAATLLVFIPTVGDYVTPTLVGGTDGLMIGNVIQQLFNRSNDAPLGAAVSVVMMLTVTLIVCGLLWGTGARRPKLQLE